MKHYILSASQGSVEENKQATRAGFEPTTSLLTRLISSQPPRLSDDDELLAETIAYQENLPSRYLMVTNQYFIQNVCILAGSMFYIAQQKY